MYKNNRRYCIMLEIKLLKDCWGSTSYFGFKDGKQYTEGYDTIEELKEQYLEFQEFQDNE